jgi:hypothetical protein
MAVVAANACRCDTVKRHGKPAVAGENAFTVRFLV